MSLLDALLLEGYREAKEVWVAIREPGVRGSGTQADPWNGATIPYAETAVYQITRSGTDATLVTSVAHGFLAGDWVTVLGAALISASPGDVYYTGTFQISSVTSTSFHYTMRNPPSSASVSGTTITCVREREQFDGVMRSMPAGAKVNIGPGLFDTKGMSFSVIAWEPQSGQTILGSGVGVTTLRLVGGEQSETAYFAVGVHYYTYLHDFAISGLTIDANVSRQRTASITCGAVLLTGLNIRISGIRAINFGSHTQSYIENFVIFSGATHPSLVEQGQKGGNCVIEDCIAERPSPNPLHNSTVIFPAGGSERPSDGFTSYAAGCVVRNCYVNAQIIYGTLIPLPIDTITYNGTIVTVTTKAPHLLSTPGNAVVQGVTVNGIQNNLFNGVFAIDEVVSPTVLKYRLETLDTPDAHNGTVGGGVPTAHPVAIESVTPDDTLDLCPELALYDEEIYEPARRYKVTTRDPHFRTVNNNAVVAGLVVSAAFNGSFAVDEYDPRKPKEFFYILQQDPDVDWTQLNFDSSFVSVGHVALSADHGTAAVVEGNRVFHCTAGGPYHDTYTSFDVAVRANYYYDVLTGPFQNLFAVSASNFAIPVSLTHVGTTATTTIYFPDGTTPFPHGFHVNDFVTISCISDTAYAGIVRITGVPARNTFEYVANGTPAGSAAGSYNTYEPFSSPFQFTITFQRRLESLTRIVGGPPYFASAKIMSEYSGYKHGNTVGDRVRITMAGHYSGGSFETGSKFNGIFLVTAITDDQTFEIEILDQNGNPTDPGAGSPDSTFCAGYFGRIWQTKRLVIERNIIELGFRTLSPSTYGWSSGIPMYGANAFLPWSAYSFSQLLIRENIIRNLNDGSAPASRAIEISGTEKALLENNIIGVDRSKSIEHQYNVQSLTTFNNITPDGNLITSVLQTSNATAPEVVTKVRADLEDAIAGWFLGL